MRTRLIAWVLAGLLLGALPAAAHAILVESTPAISATVASGEIALRLRFNSRIDRERSRLTLIRADHSTDVLPILPEGTDDLMLSKVTLTPGSYVVRWQVLAVDGHITRGDIAFTVGAAP
jgi:methionine-rich copper-binding protein CopC